MKKKFAILFLSFFCVFTSFDAFAQLYKIANKVLLAGYIYDTQTQASIPYVNVYDKNTRTGTITDTSGYFILSTRAKDTLFISCLGYKTIALFVPEQTNENKDPLLIFLEPRAYELKNITIISLKRQKQFEYDFLNLQIDNTVYDNAMKNSPVKENVLSFYKRDISQAGLVVSPISALYDAFSKEAKEKQKLNKIKQQEESANYIISKMRYSIIESITGLKDEEINNFLRWCNFRTEFLVNISDYDLIILVSQKYNDYKIKQIREKERY